MEIAPRWILIIEDEPELVDILSYYLTKEKFKVTSCPGVSRALQLTRNQRYDCMIVDMKLQEGSGEQVITTVRRDPRNLNYHTPIVVTSAHLNVDLIKRISRDIDGAFVKPYPREELVAKIKSLSLEGRSK